MPDSGEHTTEQDRAEKRRLTKSHPTEVFAVVLLSITTILTAWSAFEASKWSGQMSIAFSQASSARIAASQDIDTANARTSNQVQLWTAWLSAATDGDDELARRLSVRFPEPLATAHRDWLDAGGLETGADEATSPFVLDSFRVPEQDEALAADARADALFAKALRNNQHGDNYTLLTVLFAAVLFFTALAPRFTPRIEVTMLVGASLLFLVGVAFLASFPKLV